MTAPVRVGAVARDLVRRLAGGHRAEVEQTLDVTRETCRDLFASVRAYRRERNADHEALGRLISAVERHLQSTPGDDLARMHLSFAAMEAAMQHDRPRHDDEEDLEW